MIDWWVGVWEGGFVRYGNFGIGGCSCVEWGQM